MRGKVHIIAQFRVKHRITPAYAGKRDQIDSMREKYEDHPRLCGEKSIFPSYYELKTGSPPPMRGKVTSVSILIFSCRDHPRLCGEKG